MNQWKRGSSIQLKKLFDSELKSYGGKIDSAISFFVNVMMGFPFILLAMSLVAVLGPSLQNIIIALGFTGWPVFTRVSRVETNKLREREFVLAAVSLGFSTKRILVRHVLPNVMGPVLVLATIQVAAAILTEATLSFLGVGVPPTSPSLGTLIRIGNDFLFSGEWWITIFPGAMLVLIALSVNLLGDWLRDALNPRLR